MRTRINGWRVWVAILIICCVSCFKLQAQTTNSWVNPTSGKWETAGNWDNGALSLANAINIISVNTPAGGYTATTVPAFYYRIRLVP